MRFFLLLLLPSFQAHAFLENSFDHAHEATNALASTTITPAKKDCKNNEGETIECEGGEKIQSQVKGIADQQKTFAAISKASDVVGIAAVGATVYGMATAGNQIATMKQAAKVEKVAGYANYAAGATDFTMGAYAYVGQVKKLESLQKKSGSDEKFSDAIEKTKQAAYSHMLMGAGKVAAGYMSMYLSKETKKQVASLASITPGAVGYSQPGVLNASTGYVSPSGASTGTPAPSQVAQTPDSPVKVGSGASQRQSNAVMPEKAIANPKGNEPASAVSSIRGPASSSGIASEEKKRQELEGDQFTGNIPSAATGELNLAGGGGGGHAGAGEAKSNNNDLGNLMAGMFGKKEEGSAATGLDPADIYNNATGENRGNVQGSLQSLQSKDALFTVVHNVHERALMGGRVSSGAEVITH